jgi:methylenetetrahydrofolate dehydrogenase (NADP+)/methenyltetrahydrofolate cyclohydrolase
MPAQVLRGAGLSTRLRSEIERSIAALRAAGGRPPRLATVLVGHDPSSEAYRLSIERTMGRVGIDHLRIDLPEAVLAPNFSEAVIALNTDPDVTGVLVLMPLPSRLSPALVQEQLSPLKDVDGITPTNAGRPHMGLPSLRPSTPQGGLELLDHYGIEIEGRHAVVIGRSNVVGRPFASLLMQRHATVTICHRRTVDLAVATRTADILASAAGHAGLVDASMAKPGATVLDFGVNVANEKIVGDVAFDAVAEVAGAITPVPGGTGPVTALVLARNTVAAGFAALSGNLDHVELVKAIGAAQPSLAE